MEDVACLPDVFGAKLTKSHRDAAVSTDHHLDYVDRCMCHAGCAAASRWVLPTGHQGAGDGTLGAAEARRGAGPVFRGRPAAHQGGPEPPVRVAQRQGVAQC